METVPIPCCDELSNRTRIESMGETAGGAPAAYQITVTEDQPDDGRYRPIKHCSVFIPMQVTDPTKTITGVGIEALLAIALDRLVCWQGGPWPCEENEEACDAIHAALDALQRRHIRLGGPKGPNPLALSEEEAEAIADAVRKSYAVRKSFPESEQANGGDAPADLPGGAGEGTVPVAIPVDSVGLDDQVVEILREQGVTDLASMVGLSAEAIDALPLAKIGPARSAQIAEALAAMSVEEEPDAGDHDPGRDPVGDASASGDAVGVDQHPGEPPAQ